MWPSSLTPIYLLLGLLPLFYLGVQFALYGWYRLFSVGTVAIGGIWAGYHLDPIVAYYFSAEIWHEPFLRLAHLDDGILFASLCMIAFLIGHEVALKKKVMASFGRVPSVTIREQWLWIVIVVAIPVFLISVGGIREALVSSTARGAGQFEAKGLRELIVHNFKLLLNVVSIILAVLSSIYMLQCGRRGIPLGILGLFVASLGVMHNLSRASGLAVFIFAFVTAILKPRRKGLIVFLIALTFVLGMVGYYGRREYDEGVVNYIQAAADSRTYAWVSDSQDNSTARLRNPLGAIDRWTLKASGLEHKQEHVPYAENFFYNLNPTPSAFLNLRYTGPGLSDLAGVWGSYAITTPALAEIYFVFGWLGCLLMVPLGMLFAFFTNRVFLEKDPLVRTVVILCLVLAAGSVAIGLHKGTRAMTRPLLYASVLYAGAKYLSLKWKARRVSIHG
jgi:hypothetical protein